MQPQHVDKTGKSHGAVWGEEAMRRRRWWYGGLVGLFLLVGAVGGCTGGGDQGGGGCLAFGEVEPNDTPLTVEFLGELSVGACGIIYGSLADPGDVDSYSVLVRESLTLVVTFDPSPLVVFAVQLVEADTGQLLRDCGDSVVPEICAVPVVVGGVALAVAVVVTSRSGAGPYTLTLNAQISGIGTDHGDSMRPSRGVGRPVSAREAGIP